LTVTHDIKPILSGIDVGDSDSLSHYARREEIVRASVEGGKITALCGYEFEPIRDPTRFPVCPTCKELVSMAESMG
jgi:hypothetical protein